jgi:hypothetical protein
MSFDDGIRKDWPDVLWALISCLGTSISFQYPVILCQVAPSTSFHNPLVLEKDIRDRNDTASSGGACMRNDINLKNGLHSLAQHFSIEVEMITLHRYPQYFPISHRNLV